MYLSASHRRRADLWPSPRSRRTRFGAARFTALLNANVGLLNHSGASMYVPKHFEERDVTVLHALIRSQPLGAWVTQADGTLVVNHIPFLVDSEKGEHGILTVM